jgi:lambda repressor-like predicted transcriptional regulator
MMLGPEDLVLMLNMGWSLLEIADHAGMHVKTVEQVIVAQVKAERLTAQFLFVANLSRP